MPVLTVPAPLRRELGEEATDSLTEGVAQLERRITEEFAGLRVELARNRSDLIRWMFAFWIGQTVVTATLFTLLRQIP